MTEAASEVSQTDEPVLYLCVSDENDVRKLSVLETALRDPHDPPLPLTDDDIRAFTSMAHIDKQELTAHAVTTVLLRSAGIETDYKTNQESLQTQAILRNEQELQAVRVGKLSARLLAAITKYEATPPAANTLAEHSRQQSLLSLHDNLKAAETIVNRIVRDIADSEQLILPYTEISAAVRTHEQAYNSSYVLNGRPNIIRILAEIVDPTADLQHPAIDLLHSVPNTLHDAMIVPERIVRMMLLDAGVAKRGQDA